MSDGMKDKKDRMKKILKDHGMRICTDACGCCGSPWVRFEFNGEIILDDDYAEMDMFEEEES